MYTGQREFVNMLPLVCNDAVAILFMFDLSRKSTLNSVKEWYRQARGFNKVSWCPIQGLDGAEAPLGKTPDPKTSLCTVALSCIDHMAIYFSAKPIHSNAEMLALQTAIPFLVGTKFDTFSTFPRDEQEEITKQVRDCS